MYKNNSSYVILGIIGKKYFHYASGKLVKVDDSYKKISVVLDSNTQI